MRIFLRFYLLIFRERGREGERERDKHWLVASHVPSAGDLACNPGTCPDWESNQQSFGSQASTPCTEPHQPGEGWRSWFSLSASYRRYFWGRSFCFYLRRELLPHGFEHILPLQKTQAQLEDKQLDGVGEEIFITSVNSYVTGYWVMGL